MLVVAIATFGVAHAADVHGDLASPVLRIATGPAEVLFNSGTPGRLHGIQEPEPNSGRVHAWPSGLGAKARYGLALINDEWLTFVVDERASGDYEIKLDLNTDGDLTNDSWTRTQPCSAQLPLDGPFASDPGETTAFFDTMVKGRHAAFALTVLPHRDAFLQHIFTKREGVLQTDDATVRFVLSGIGGTYRSVYFDPDPTLPFGLLDRSDAYTNEDPFVNLGGRSYRFSIDEKGDYLELRPLAETRPGRVRLAPGDPAPTFSFVDLDGQPGTLEDYRGRVVLLYFWGTWCGPCRTATKSLRDLYARLQGSGLELLGIDAKDDPDVLRDYVRQQGIPWRETAGDYILERYRVDSYPSLVLIDQDGAIVTKSRILVGLEERIVSTLARLHECTP
jgi:thiol-disulfide isomerase/thioredoxin